MAVPSRIEWKEIRSIDGGEKTPCRRVANKRVSKWERNEGKKIFVARCARARMYVCVHAVRDHDRDKEVNETGSF